MPKPLIEIKSIVKSYGLQNVLDDISFQIGEGEKIALIGRNGSGKSTLFRIITGEEKADLGEIRIFDTAEVGLIKQHEVLPDDISCIEYLQKKTEKEDWKIRKIASQFGLNEAILNQTPMDLSGGYQMRIKIVDMLANEPNILLLDEPVNYLDLQTLLMLQDFLKSYRGAMLIIAHDREFLEFTCDMTYELERGLLTTYKGKVSDYFKWKEEQLEFKKKTNKKLAKEIAHTQVFVDRFRYKASLASQAQSKIKYINKLKEQISEIKLDLAKTKITIPSPQLSNGPALRVKTMTIGYDKSSVVESINLDILRGEKILIAGENGQGKSTFLKTIIGKIEPVEGEYKWWHRSKIGYYDQKTDQALRMNDTVMDHLLRSATKDTSSESILMMAGNFLFKGHDLDKKVSVLSGGERARLCLAGILLQEFNTLILDEPTNHLDVETSEALSLALKEYKGTVIFVSHAQSFVKILADKIYEIKDGRMRLFIGNYKDYVDELRDLARLNIQTDDPVTEKGDSSDFHDRKEIHLQVRAIQREQKKIMENVNKMEKEKSTILKYFFDNPLEYNAEMRIKLDALENELPILEEKWMTLENEIEDLRKNL